MEGQYHNGPQRNARQYDEQDWIGLGQGLLEGQFQ